MGQVRLTSQQKTGLSWDATKGGFRGPLRNFAVLLQIAGPSPFYEQFTALTASRSIPWILSPTSRSIPLSPAIVAAYPKLSPARHGGVVRASKVADGYRKREIRQLGSDF
jgi:hypothetical protein